MKKLLARLSYLFCKRIKEELVYFTDEQVDDFFLEVLISAEEAHPAEPITVRRYGRPPGSYYSETIEIYACTKAVKRKYGIPRFDLRTAAGYSITIPQYEEKD